MKHPLYLLLLLLLLTSCAHYKDIPYFQNSAQFDGTGKEFLYDITIKPKDELNILVFANDNTLAAQFNMRERTGLRPGQKIGADDSQGGLYHYLVDTNGDIEFPLVGAIHLGGLTIEQANAAVKEKLSPYFKDDSGLMVNTLMLNYYVSVMGEVKKPNTYTVSRPKITILEALAQAGDMTIYGKRDNVKLLRELPDGTYEVHELDMRDADILNSPYYYLQQRDIVYVEPNEAMAQNAKVGTTTRLWVRGASITISLGSLLYRVLQ